MAVPLMGQQPAAEPVARVACPVQDPGQVVAAVEDEVSDGITHHPLPVCCGPGGGRSRREPVEVADERQVVDRSRGDVEEVGEEPR
jgi:hypothetical protein